MDRSIQLRGYLGELIPDGGTDADTLFTTAEIQDLLVNFTGPTGANIYLAAAEGWARKAGSFANLVTTGQSGATRNMSDLLDHAQTQIKLFFDLAYNRRTPRVGRITRPGTTVT